MSFEVKVIAHSVSFMGKELATLQLKYPRFIHSELMTHRVFSRNASSSRAIPVAKMIEQVNEDPARPVYWAANRPGMQATEELTGDNLESVQDLWGCAAAQAAHYAEEMSKLGAHKAIVNRILEPFQWMHTIVSATEWDNFFKLRCHPDAQQEIQLLACMMRDALAASEPTAIGVDKACDWHVPYISADERARFEGVDDPFYIDSIADMLKVSAARCARVSYLKHDGSTATLEEDLALANKLIEAGHWSPFEHQAIPYDEYWKVPPSNFKGWVQHRSIIENGHPF